MRFSGVAELAQLLSLEHGIFELEDKSKGIFEILEDRLRLNIPRNSNGKSWLRQVVPIVAEIGK